MKLNTFTRAYITAMLWSTIAISSEDPEGTMTYEELNYEATDIAPATLRAIMRDCDDFVGSNADDLEDGSDEQAGHDFWLTRERHGCGFWDGGWPEPAATRLTDAAHAYGSFELYVGDDGLIHCQNELPADYEECSQCGFDHEYEPAEAARHHLHDGDEAG